MNRIPLRILHVIDTGGPGGAETVLANIVENLEHERFVSRVLLPDQDWLHDRLAGGPAEVSVVPRSRSPDFQFLWALNAAVRDFDADVIHTHLLTSSVYGSVTARLAGSLPLVATFHGLPDVAREDGLIWMKSRLLSRSRNRIVFVADHLRRDLQETLGLPDHLCLTIVNGSCFADPAPAPSESTGTKDGSGSTSDRIRKVGALGNIRPAKDYRTLLMAAKVVIDQRPDTQFLIAGEGSSEETKSLRKLRDDLGLRDAVSFLGFVENVPEFIRKLDLFVSSSITEGLPLAVLEAAGLGCPIVATRCGGNDEVLGVHGRGALVPPGDPDSLGATIAATLSARDGGRTRAERIAADVRERFAMTRMIERYSKLYRQLNRSPQSPLDASFAGQ